jgi:magnesium transporter
MKSVRQKRSKKTGLSPGALVHVGREYEEKSKITLIRYNETIFEEKEVASIPDLLREKNNEGIVWINVDGLEAKLIEDVGGIYDLHPLILEDILNTDQRPKTEDFGNYIYIVLKNFHNQDNVNLPSEQVSIILGKNFILSFKEKETLLFEPIRERLRSNKGRIRKAGPDNLAHALIDNIVDNYFFVLEELEERIEYLEDELVRQTNPVNLQAIHSLKRELILLGKSLWPLREAISTLERTDSELITASTHIYFKDIFDHIIAIIETVDTYREMLSGMLDIYLSTVSNRLNEVMKVLTIIATIFMPLTFLAGVYGMNFKYMPELEWHFGYFGVLSLMLGVALLMLKYFRNKKWI